MKVAGARMSCCCRSCQTLSGCHLKRGQRQLKIWWFGVHLLSQNQAACFLTFLCVEPILRDRLRGAMSTLAGAEKQKRLSFKNEDNLFAGLGYSGIILRSVLPGLL